MNPIPPWLRRLWDTWDVRVMILFSLGLQVILFILGNRRKYTVKIWIRIILWFAYLIADWIATATLGKLSEAQAEPGPSNILRAVWAPLLLLHLGGPDTITAYALEDNQLWMRHLLGLVVEVVLVIYVLLLSWTRSWLSLAMNFFMFVAGIIKYVERTLSLKLASSGQAEGTIPVFDIDTLVEKPYEISDREKLVVAYQLFSSFRPDITNYISTRENLSSSSTKLIIRFMDNIQKTGLWDVNMDYLLQILDGLKPAALFEIIEVELGFLFDVLYTKAPITYTKWGCIFRFTSVFCSLCAMGVCFTIIRIHPKNHFPIVDITITGILLIGAIVVEFYALVKLLSSNWAVIWVSSRSCRNHFGRGKFGNFLISLLSRQEKRNWSNCMGQFNLLKYCANYRKEEGRSILRVTGIQKLWQRYQHTYHTEVPRNLKENVIGSFSSSTASSFVATRGEKALEKYGLKDDLKWSTELDFDESIITWHLVTDICYYGLANSIPPTEKDNTAETYKVLSDYMMYLLVMQPDMILPGYRKDFWFSHVSETLGGFFYKQRASMSGNDAREEQKPFLNVYSERLKSRGALELEGNALKIAEKLKEKVKKWEIVEAVWSEMLCYAAIACPHLNHARQLRRGGEFLTHLWLFLTMTFIRDT